MAWRMAELYRELKQSRAVTENGSRSADLEPI
jgi:hypothetical protein